MLYTSDEDITILFCEIIPYLCLFVILDAVHGVQAGNIKALGISDRACIVTIIFYYCVGLPMAYYLAFERNYELVGIWIGYLTAMGLVDIVVAYFVITAEWKAKFIV